MRPYRLAVVVAVGFVTLVGCAGDEPDSSPPERRLMALLTSGELVSGTTARLTARVRLTKGTLRPVSSRLMAVTPDRRLVAVLLSASRPRRREVVVLGTRPLRVRSRMQLPVDRKTRASTLVAPVPDRLVVLGERETRAGGRLPVGWVIDIPSRDLVSSWRVDKAPHRNWTILDAAADLKRLYLSYHGGCNPDSPDACTTGADMVSWERRTAM
jgi:hypothetical protein